MGTINYLVASYSSSSATGWQQPCSSSMAIYQQRASPRTGEYDLGVWFPVYFGICFAHIQFVIQGIANREHLNGGWWGGDHACHGCQNTQL